MNIKIYDLYEVAIILKVHINTVRLLVKKEKLGCIMVGGNYRVREDQLNNYLGINNEDNAKQL